MFELWLRDFLGSVKRKILFASLLLIHGLSVDSTYRRNRLELIEDHTLSYSELPSNDYILKTISVIELTFGRLHPFQEGLALRKQWLILKKPLVIKGSAQHA